VASSTAVASEASTETADELCRGSHVWYLDRRPARWRPAEVLHIDRSCAADAEGAGYSILLEGVERSTEGSRLRPRAGETPPAVPEGYMRPAVALSEASFREIELSTAGGFDQQVLGDGAVDWLSAVRAARTLRAGEPLHLAGLNTFICVSADRASELARDVLRLSDCGDLPAGSRFTVAAAHGDRAAWLECLHPLRLKEVFGARAGRAAAGMSGVAVLTFGDRCCESGALLDHGLVMHAMDPVDRGEGAMPSGWKAGVSWTPMPDRVPAAWARSGCAAHVVAVMTDGAVIEPFESGLDDV
jgi:hypothetical protein